MAFLLLSYPKIIQLAILLSDKFQLIYDWIMALLLRLPILNRIILFYFWILGAFRVLCMSMVEKYTLPNLNMCAFIIAINVTRTLC
jgi:hypothetical protein